MPNYSGNPHIAQHGTATRFGVGNCPRAARQQASPPWGIRHAVRRLCAATYDASRPLKLSDFLAVLQTPDGKVKGEHLAAARLMLSAFSGCASASQRLEDIVDGKLLTPRSKDHRPDLVAMLCSAGQQS